MDRGRGRRRITGSNPLLLQLSFPSPSFTSALSSFTTLSHSLEYGSCSHIIHKHRTGKRGRGAGSIVDTAAYYWRDERAEELWWREWRMEEGDLWREERMDRDNRDVFVPQSVNEHEERWLLIEEWRMKNYLRVKNWRNGSDLCKLFTYTLSFHDRICEIRLKARKLEAQYRMKNLMREKLKGEFGFSLDSLVSVWLIKVWGRGEGEERERGRGRGGGGRHYGVRDLPSGHLS